MLQFYKNSIFSSETISNKKIPKIESSFVWKGFKRGGCVIFFRIWLAWKYDVATALLTNLDISNTDN